MTTDTDEDQDEYWQEYYDENREEILENRREKYQNDEEYREKVKEQARQNYHDNKGPKKEPGRDEGPNKPRVFNEEVCVSTGELMQKINEAVARPTILKWVREGVIPDDAYYESAGDMKWWRPQWVDFFTDHVEDRDDYSQLDEWQHYLHSEWMRFKNS